MADDEHDDRGSDGRETVRAWLAQAKELQLVDPVAAKDRIIEARLLARSEHDDAGEAEALYRLAVLTYYEADAAEAFQLSAQANEIAQASGAHEVASSALYLNGIIFHSAGDFAQALVCGHAALDALDPSEQHERADLLNFLASVHYAMGDYDRALGAYDAALAAQDAADHDFTVIVLSNIADLRCVRGEHLLAVSLAEKALQIGREHDSDYVPTTLTNLGRAYEALGDLERSQACYEEALRLFAQQEARGLEAVPDGRAQVLLARGRLRASQGLADEANADLLAALDIAQQGGLRSLELELRAALASSFKALGDFEAALEHQEARFALHQEIFNEGTDLRIRTLQASRDAEEARLNAQLLSERSANLQSYLSGSEGAAERVEIVVLERLAALGEHEGSDLHGRHVGNLAAAIASELGEEEGFVERLRVAARLHDIGKIGVPDGVLGKPGPLTPAEIAQVRTHTTIGASVLGGSDSPLMQVAATVALSHHERWDGSGYPSGLMRAEIPLEARIVAVADAYETLVAAQHYREPSSPGDAVRRIREAAGRQFDPRVVEALVSVMSAQAPADELVRGYDMGTDST